VPRPAEPVLAAAIIARLARTEGAAAREALLRAHQELHDPAVVERLCDEVGRLAYADLAQAERLALAAKWLARAMADDYCRARSIRAAAHVLHAKGRYRSAVKRYESAAHIFRSLRNPIEIGRTLSSSLQALIYLGRYAEASRSARIARRIFVRAGDRLRIARLDCNVGNVLYRQDRFREAMRLYRRAYQTFSSLGEPMDVALTLRNLAVCHTSLNEFAEALRVYQDTRRHCERHDLPRLAAKADYNIAYVYYLRGQYTRAIELYGIAREEAIRLGDRYHQALCDLDQAELYLELNLIAEGAALAHRAYATFSELGMGYEAAKGVAFLAIAQAHLSQTDRALESFRAARRLFIAERNAVWPALIRLYEGLVLWRAKRWRAARGRARTALRFFSRASLPGRAALCQLLLARLDLQAGRIRRARSRCLKALENLARAESQPLRIQAYTVLGQIEEARGDVGSAYRALKQAHAGFENLRSHLQADDLKIAFLKDKLAIYEGLVCLSLGGERRFAEAAFAYIEQAKSRSLADLIAFRAHALPAPVSTRSEWADRVRRLREDLTACHRQIEIEETSPRARPRPAADRLRRRASRLEAELLRTLADRRAGDEEFRSVQSGGATSLSVIRAALPPGAALLEYYEARGQLYACVVSRDRLEIRPLGPVSPVRTAFRLLQFQLSKFRLGPEYVRRFTEPLHRTAEAHLQELYRALIGPIRGALTMSRLTIVPHGFLHYVPFHALFDGRTYLGDQLLISYAPSASVHYLCSTRRSPAGNRSLVLGVPDAAAPHITTEVEAVAATLPHAQVYLGEEATEERLRTVGAESRFIHIATHGLFRRDNPMFSSIRLGTSELRLFDLYRLQLPAELVTLSGCGTGLSVVMGGDDLIGLVRGLLYAGAQAALVTLWDVHDQSTAMFMRSFYEHLQAHPDKARATQSAMQEVRRAFPHPYHWAPFVLIGKDGAS